MKRTRKRLKNWHLKNAEPTSVNGVPTTKIRSKSIMLHIGQSVQSAALKNSGRRRRANDSGKNKPSKDADDSRGCAAGDSVRTLSTADAKARETSLHVRGYKMPNQRGFADCAAKQPGGW